MNIKEMNLNQLLSLAGEGFWRMAFMELADRLTWKPIETAPKDGTHIYVACFDKESIGFGKINGKWVAGQTVAHWHEDGFYPSLCQDDRGIALELTHWMPLHDQPEELK